MADGMRKLGLKVALAGLQSYRNGIQNINKGNEDVRRSMDEVAQGSQKMDLRFAAVTGAMQALASQGIDFLLGKLKTLVGQVKGMASEAGVVAGLKGAFEGLTASVGMTGEEMLQKFRVSTGGMVTMKDAMMSFNKAAQLISTDFAVMLPDAMEHLGKVSRATGAPLKYLLDSLALGVGRLSPMILDNLSIQVTLAEASARAAEMFGKNTKELSKQEKQLGMANIVMEKLAANTAHMPSVTGSMTAQTAALSTTIADVRTEVGLRFLPVLSEWMSITNAMATTFLPKLIPAAEAVSNALMGFIEWFKQIVPMEKIVAGLSGAFDNLVTGIQNALGPAMEIWGRWVMIIRAHIEGIIKILTGGGLGKAFDSLPEMINAAFEVIGPIIQEAAKYFTYFFRIARDVVAGIERLFKGDVQGATKLFSQAFNTAIATVIALLRRAAGQVVEWGKALVASYSKGIIEGVKAYLQTALQNVANFIKGFMAPGSPPKFLPDIGTWGAGAMEEYIKGMGAADFSMLSNYTGQFKTELAGLVESGALGAGRFADTFFELRGTVTQVMDQFKETGKVAAGALDILPLKLGKAGEAMAELIEKQLGMQVFDEQLQEVAKRLEQVDAAEQALSSQVKVVMAEIEAGLSQVALQERELDAALQPFINNLERLQATEDLVTDELRRQFEAGEIGLEEYEDRVKAAKDQTREAKTALDLEKARQVDARQAIDAQKEGMKLQQDQVRAEEDSQRAIIEQQRAMVQEEAAAIEAKRKAAAEEIATLEARLAFHRETLDIMKQQQQMLKELAEKTAPGGKGEEGEPVIPEIELPEIEGMEPILETLDQFRQRVEELPSGPAFDLGDLLPDVEAAKGEVSTWFANVWSGIQTSVQQSPLAQWILNKFMVDLPIVVGNVRAWIQENFPYAYATMATAFDQVMAGDFAGALETFMTYFEFTKNRITAWWQSDVQPILDAVKAWWDENWPKMLAVGLTVWNTISSVIMAVIQTIVETAWPPLEEAIGNLMKTLGNLGINWGTIWDAVSRAVLAAVRVIGAVLAVLIGIVTGLVTAITRVLSVVVEAWTISFAAVVNVIAGFLVYFKGVYEVIAGIFTGDFPRILNGLKMQFIGVWTFLTGLFGLVVGLFKSSFEVISEFVKGFIEGFIAFFQNLYDNLVGNSIIPDLLSDLWTMFTDTFSDVLLKVGEFVQGVIDFFVGLWDGLMGPEGTITKLGKDILTTITGALEDTITDAGLLVTKFSTLGANLLQGLIDGVTGAVINLKNAVSGAIGDAIQAGKDILGIRSASKVFFEMADFSAEGWTKGWDKKIPQIERQMAMNVAPALMMGDMPKAIGTSATTNNVDQSTRYGDRNVSMPVTVIDSKVSLAEFKNNLRTVLNERG